MSWPLEGEEDESWCDDGAEEAVDDDGLDEDAAKAFFILICSFICAKVRVPVLLEFPAPELALPETALPETALPELLALGALLAFELLLPLPLELFDPPVGILETFRSGRKTID